MTPKLRAGVVGLGFGANHARVLSEMPGVELVAVADRDEALLYTGAARDVASYPDHASMLAEERLDAVVVAVPASLHVEIGLAAIEAGCAVLIEKPLAPSLPEGRRLVEAAERAGVGLMPGHIERFNPALQELARRVHAGEIGQVLQLTARRMGAIRHPPVDVNVIHDSAIHDIDAMRFVLGAEVEEVYATALTSIVMPVEDSVNATLKFAAAGDGPAPIGTIEVNWLSPRRVRDLAVLGTEGLFVLRYAAQSLELYRMPRRSGPVKGWSLSAKPEDGLAESIAVQPQEQLVQELSAFVAAARDGTPMPVTARDGLAALAVADALTLSARSGRPLGVEGLQP